MAIMQSRYVESNHRVMASKEPRSRGVGVSREQRSLAAQKPAGTSPLIAKLLAGAQGDKA